MAPSAKERTATGWRLAGSTPTHCRREHRHVAAAAAAAGAAAGEISFFAPVSLFFFFVVILAMPWYADRTAPMHFFFLAAASSPSPAARYWSTSLHPCGLCCGIAGVGRLVVSYLRCGRHRFAFVEAPWPAGLSGGVLVAFSSRALRLAVTVGAS